MKTFQPDPKLDLVLERTLDVPAEKIFEVWTTPSHIKNFFVPRPWKIADCSIDLRPGGKFMTVMQSPEGQSFPNAGCYLEIVKNEKLVWTDALQENYRPSATSFMTAMLLLEKLPGNKTKYTAIAIHKDEETRKKHEEMGFHQGWGTVVDQMVEYIKSL